MKRARPRQHVRRTRTGKRVLVNKDVAARPKTVRKNYGMGVFAYRKSLGGMHKGNRVDNEVRALYGDPPIDPTIKGNRKKEIDFAMDMLSRDVDQDISNLVVTDKGDNTIIDFKYGDEVYDKPKKKRR